MKIILDLDDTLATEFYQYVGGKANVTDPDMINKFLTAYFLGNFVNTITSNRTQKAQITATESVKASLETDLGMVNATIKSMQSEAKII